MFDQEVVKLYDSGMSIREVCKKLDTYPSKVYGILKKNTTLRTKSEVQATALKQGKVKHPTEGKKRPENIKLKISKAMGDYWGNLTQDERDYFADISKKRWDSKTDKEKAEFHKSGIDAIRKAAEVGSKMEYFVIEKLKAADFNVLHHRKSMLSNKELEVDLLLPALKVAIEVDGPSHQLPIWGEEALKKRQKSDAQKNGLLLNNGYVVIRLKFNDNQTSLYNKTKAVEEVIKLLNTIKKKFPTKSNRYYEVKI